MVSDIQRVTSPPRARGVTVFGSFVTAKIGPREAVWATAGRRRFTPGRLTSLCKVRIVAGSRVLGGSRRVDRRLLPSAMEATFFDYQVV
jgi:hypothetical protein